MRRLLPLLPLLLCLGCDDSSTAPTSPAGGSVLRDPAALARWVDDIGAKVSEIRELKFLRPVRTSLVSRSDLPKLLDSIAHLDQEKDGGPDGLTFDQFGSAMGFTRTAESLDSSSDEFSSSQTEGFYVFGTDHLWIVSDASTDTAELGSTIAHELVHALQDQHFDLKHNSFSSIDAFYAHRILVEGDAEYCQILYANGNPSIDRIRPEVFQNYEALEYTLRQTPSLATLPRLVTLPVLLRYTWGPRVVHSLRCAAGWAGVDEAFRHPQQTTSEMLAPNGYGQFPRIQFKDFDSSKAFPAFAALGTWTSLSSDRLGALLLSTLMTTWTNRSTPMATPSRIQGWQGDRFWIWRKGTSGNYAVGGLVDFNTEFLAGVFLADFNALAPDAMEGRSFRSEAKGSTVALAWGNLTRSELDSLWKDLGSSTASTMSAGRAASAGSLPKFPVQPWSPLNVRR